MPRTTLCAPRHRSLTPLLPLALALPFAGCGGGGSSSGSSGANAPKDLEYGLPRQTLLTGLDVELVPSVQGKVKSWEVSPPLPAGLTLGPDGRISGRIDDPLDEATYVVRARNGSGKAEAALSLRAARPSSWLYLANGADGSVSGWAYDAPQATLFPVGKAVDPAAEPTPEEVLVHPDGRFVLVTNRGATGQPSNVSVFERVDGRLEALAPEALGVGPHDAELSPAGDVLYVVSSGSDEVRAFTLDEATGALQALGTPLVLGAQPVALAIDPLARRLYVACAGAHTLEVVPLDAGGGFVGNVVASGLNGGMPSALSLAPDGSHLFVTLSNFQIVLALSVDDQGNLTVQDSPDCGPDPVAVAAHPRGDVVHVLDRTEGTLRAYSHDPVTGALFAAGAPLPVGAQPARLTVDPAGRELLVSCAGSDELLVLDARDPLAPTEARRYRTLAGPGGVGTVVTPAPERPTTKTAYVAGASGTIDVLEIDTLAGTATAVGGAVPTGAHPAGLAVDPRGAFVWCAARDDDALFAYAIDPDDGTLTSLGGPIAVGGAPSGLALDASGAVLYVTSLQNDTVSAYAIQRPSGTLTFLDQVATDADPVVVVIDPTERFLYTANAADGSVGAYRVDGGHFTGVAAGVEFSGARGLAFSPGGERLYVALDSADQVVPLAIDAATGDLTVLPSAAAKGGPTALALHPFAPRAYVALPAPGRVGRYAVQAGGTLASLSPLEAGLGTVDVAVDPLGRVLFALNADGGDLVTFRLDQAGAGTESGRVPVGAQAARLALRVRVE